MSDARHLQEGLRGALSAPAAGQAGQGRADAAAGAAASASAQGRDAPAAPPAPEAGLGLPRSAGADLMRPPLAAVRFLSLSLAAAVLVGIAWASQAVMEEVARGEGRIIPAGKLRTVQYLEGGIVKAIAVKEGDRVRRGQLLLRMDPVASGSLLDKNRALLAGLQAKIIRLRAELAGSPLRYEEAFEKTHPRLVAQNRKLFDARRREIRSALAALEEKARQKRQEIREARARLSSLEQAVEIARQELQLIEPLARDRVVSRASLLAARGKLNDLEGQRQVLALSLPRLEAALDEIAARARERRSAFRAEALSRLNEAQIKHAALAQSLRADADKLRRTEVRSPVDGIIKTLFVNTIGQVVKPGGDIAEIVPLSDNLLVETRIRPRDIAFLRPGQRAVVKLTSYDYAIYGALEGSLLRIGADSITDRRGRTYYLAYVRTRSNSLASGGRQLPVILGMMAQVDIVTGRKSLLQYLTKPLHRMASDSFRER